VVAGRVQLAQHGAFLRRGEASASASALSSGSQQSATGCPWRSAEGEQAVAENHLYDGIKATIACFIVINIYQKEAVS
jgi:hypothetical protein